MGSLLTNVLSASAFALLTTSAAVLEERFFDPVCVQISNAISSASDVYYFGHLKYAQGIEHWASSSTQTSKCVVEPGSAADVGIILGIVGSTSTPFAVKGGGHTSNPGFSSTSGVHISMARFDEVTYNSGTQTVVLGAGLTWDDVYAQLAPYNVNVVGGRVPGVGIAGFTLGGGYSWKTNQFGLTVDTVTAYELVKPDGSVVTVTHSSDPQLFFALKGGFNNFGIVTRFTLKTFPQTQVWGGVITYSALRLDDVSAAVNAFSASVTDPKAAIITNYNFVLGQPGIAHIMFYDGPSPPSGIFDDFMDIPHVTQDVSTRSFLSLIQSVPAGATSGTRGTFQTVPLQEITPSILDAVVNETKFWGPRLGLLESAFFLSYAIEPFLPSILSHNPSGQLSAYPPSRSMAFLPANVYFSWLLPLSDDGMIQAIKLSAQRLTNLAIAEGQSLLPNAPKYPNYAITGTPLSEMYGANVPTLQTLKASIDPTNVMGLAGGWKF